MDNKFEQTEMTTSILMALETAIGTLKDVPNKNLLREYSYLVTEWQNLFNKIKQDQLDIRLVSREY